MDGLSANFTFSNLVDLLNMHDADNKESRLICESGLDSLPAAGRCVECEEYLCESCIGMHRKLKKFTTHKILLMADIKRGGVQVLEQKRYCADHKEELKLYCRTCEKVICRDCTIVTHKQHDYAFIKDVKEELAAVMENLTAKVEACRGEFQQQSQLLDRAIAVLMKNAEDTETEITRVFTNYIQKLELCRDALLKKIAEQKTTDLNHLSAEKNAAEHTMSNMSSAVAFTQKMLSSASPTDLALMSKQTMTQLKHLANTHTDTHAVPRPTAWGFHQEKNLLQFSVHKSVAAIINLDDKFSLGRNVAYVRLHGDAICSDPRVEANIVLPFGATCSDLNISQADKKSWYISFFIPLPGQVSLSVSVCGVPAEGSPCSLQCRSVLTPGALVRRGPHWQWSDQDGGPNSVGRFIGYQPHTNNCCALVQWNNKERSIGYRWGAGDMYDIELLPQ